MINFAGIYNNRYNMKYGFVRVAAAIPIVKVGDCKIYAQQNENQNFIADGEGGQNIIFSQLSITRETFAGFVGQAFLLEGGEIGLILSME